MLEFLRTGVLGERRPEKARQLPVIRLLVWRFSRGVVAALEQPRRERPKINRCFSRRGKTFSTHRPTKSIFVVGRFF
jgi:hypothetical protein